MLRSENGSALVLVLVVSSLLLGSSFWAISTYTAGVRATEQLMNKFEARLGAESALQILKYYGATGRFDNSTLSNSLSESLDFPKMLSLTDQEYKLMLGNNIIHISLLDSFAVLNISYLDNRVLSRLLHYFGLDDKERFVIRDSFKDWIDKNDFTHVNGAESYYYRHQNVAYGPRNSASLQSIWEISLLRGMDETIWDEIRPFFAMMPKPGQNMQTMSPTMLAVWFGLDKSTGEQLAALREDRGYLTTMAIEDITGQKYYDSFSGLGNFPSRIVRVRIEAESGDSRERWLGWLSCLPDRQAPYRILAWQEGIGE